LGLLLLEDARGDEVFDHFSHARFLRHQLDLRHHHLQVSGVVLQHALQEQAETQARGLKDELVRAAHSENAKLLEETRKKLAEEERRLARELRAEMAQMSLHATEKMLRRGLDKPFQDRLVQEALADFEKWTTGAK